jgi:hypothetical protein
VKFVEISDEMAAALAQGIYKQIQAYVDANPEKYELFLQEWREKEASNTALPSK